MLGNKDQFYDGDYPQFLSSKCLYYCDSSEIYGSLCTSY